MRKSILIHGIGLSLLALSFAITPVLATAQEKTTPATLQEKLTAYHREKPAANLYVHIDRNNYLPGDTIWFKAYMLSAHQSELLYVRIADDKKNIVLEKQIPAYDIRTHGEMVIPFPERKLNDLVNYK